MSGRADGGAAPADDPADDYTVDELMVCVLAACFQDGDQVLNGLSSFIPVCAIELARRTHAPGLVWIAGGSGVSPRSPRLTVSTFEWPLWRDSVMYVDVATELWDWVADERLLRTFCAGAAQIDAYGNANNSVIGSFDRPRVRLPGTAGLGDMGSLSKRIVYWVTDHSPRTLVERVDFRSAAGYLGGGGERARLGLGGGPDLVVTNLAVLDFAPVSERMRLRSVHPGVTVEQVLAATGFEPVLPAEVAATAVPTVRQVDLIRRVIDPEGYRRRGFRPPA
ncbi:CoA-transferase [Actinomadura sp. 7K534]|uniref:CoA-transferase subunit beta n=1 Tax=Actinomadura sp. 7K534 TaxID=2530366 RepID=UPI0010517136|nr:CoA-transferase [Actinomadura sp. 7K534]TDB98189.1 3-oxoacid CoA-transferase [Actinomadura sp. 7K534]